MCLHKSCSALAKLMEALTSIQSPNTNFSSQTADLFFGKIFLPVNLSVLLNELQIVRISASAQSSTGQGGHDHNAKKTS
ncbi:hypothetical protein BpHYR1_015601 [Brachionus plicatilis]|uniref:Uncharacterized protein n=1 Tax=Brachionus plicatilis TaxID=10195 RepID=A0A3M7PRG2_BRAPC|nr:hypothetical protein BpHYR1_015601 [Brachionus plicatilis]